MSLNPHTGDSKCGGRFPGETYQPRQIHYEPSSDTIACKSNWSFLPFNVFRTCERQRNYRKEGFARNGQAFSGTLIFVVHAQ